MSKRDYDVLEPLRHDGTRYEPGAVVGLTDEQAQRLMAAKPPVVRPSEGVTGDGSGTAAGPIDEAERIEALVEFMNELEPPEDPTGSDFWTNSGKPETRALADALGWDSVSAKERDIAWNESLEARKQAGGGAS